ncbi:hypothetical protein ADIARSV_0966 [Arcticibacter svalbardensis MN12-7]|uniref:Uncharacterized protein n=1 Tax=Arcticibacter svalbardensis MN12-7 TaxID=1150600 RepID=R9H3R0_9SPHI|nr:hypothetical protein ADIARSV_0966 [Arcticibacter svalbardensis MN12-7]
MNEEQTLSLNRKFKLIILFNTGLMVKSLNQVGYFDISDLEI